MKSTHKKIEVCVIHKQQTFVPKMIFWEKEGPGYLVLLLWRGHKDVFFAINGYGYASFLFKHKHVVWSDHLMDVIKTNPHKNNQCRFTKNW